MRWRRWRQDLRLWVRRRSLVLSDWGSGVWSRRWVQQSVVALALLLLLSALHRADAGLLGPLSQSLERKIMQPYDFPAAVKRVQQSSLWQSARVPDLVERLREAITAPVMAPTGNNPGSGQSGDNAAPADQAVPALAPANGTAARTEGETGLAAALLPPVPGTIARSFGYGTAAGQQNTLFQGLELETQPGTPVRAAAGGVVLTVTTDSTYGRRITIDHGDGLRTVYGFTGQVLVKAQQRLESGGAIGLAEGSADAATTRVYFEVEVDGRAVDPSPFLSEEGGAN